MTTKQDYISNVTASLRNLNDGVHPEHTQIEDELADRCFQLADALARTEADCMAKDLKIGELRHRLRAVGA